tara:strand:- start:33635 stop:47050 length:13416 start_codon:yes stop_codon:yes gene_type:complete
MKKTLQIFSLCIVAIVASFSAFAQSTVSNFRIDNNNPCFGDKVVITASFSLDGSLSSADVDFNINGFDTTVTGVTAGDRNFTVPVSRILVGANTFTVDTVGTTPQTVGNSISFVGRQSIDVDFQVIPDNDVCTGEDIILSFSNISGGDTLSIFLTLNGDSVASEFTVIPLGPGAKLTDTIYAGLVSSTPLNQEIVISEIRDDAGCSVMPVNKKTSVNVFPNPQAVFNPFTDKNRLGFTCDNDNSIEFPVLFSDAQNNAIAYITVNQGGLLTNVQTTGTLTAVGAGQYLGKVVLTGLTSVTLVDNITLTIDSVKSGSGTQECTFDYMGAGDVANFDLHQKPNADINFSTNPVCDGVNDTLTLTLTNGSATGLVAYIDGTTNNFSIDLATNEYVASYSTNQSILLDSVVNDFCVVDYSKENKGLIIVNPRPEVNAITFDNVCIGESANFDFVVNANASQTYGLRYSINGPAGGPSDSTYSGLSNGSNTFAFNAPSTGSIGTYTVSIDTLYNEITGCTAIASDFQVNGVSGNAFTFDITDTLNATVLVNGLANEYICYPAANGATTNIDSVEVRIYVSALPTGVANLNFTFDYLNDAVVSNGQSYVAPTANFIADASVAGFTHYVSYLVASPTDTLSVELLDVSFTDAGGNSCQSTFDGSSTYIASVQTRKQPVFNVSSTSKTFDCYSLDDINYQLSFSNIDEIDFVIEDITNPGAPIVVGTLSTIINLGTFTSVTTSFEDLAATAGAAINEGTPYQITFTNIRQKANANYLTDCNYEITASNVFEAYLVPTPKLVSTTADPTMMCDDSTSVLTLVAEGDFTFSFDLIKTSIGGVVSTNRYNFNANATYNSGADETTFPLNIIPDSTASYLVDSLFITYNGEVCRAEILANNTASVTVEQSVTNVSISSNKSVICDGGNVNLTVVTTGGSSNYAFDIETTTASGTTTTPYDNTDGVINLTLSEASTFKVVNVRNNDGAMCPSLATASISIDVRTNATASIVSTDSIFCAGSTTGAMLEIVGVGNAVLEFEVVDNFTSTSFPNYTTTYTMVNDTDVTFIELPLNPAQNLEYTLISINDDSNPICINSPLSSVTNIALNIEPTADISIDPTLACFGGDGNIQLNFAGGNAVDNADISYSLRYKNGADITSTPNPRIAQDTSLLGSGTFVGATFSNIQQDTTFEVYNVSDSYGCTSAAIFSADVMVRANASITDLRSAYDTVCFDSDAQFILEFNQSNVDFDVYYNGGTVVTTQSGDTISIAAFPGSTVEFDVDSIAYDGSVCYVSQSYIDSVFIANQGSVTVVNNAPIVACFGDDVNIAFNSTAGTGVLSLVLSDGQGGTYNFDMMAGTKDTMVVSGLASGTYTFAITSASTYSSEGSCTAVFNAGSTQAVTVGNEIIVGISTLTTSVCEGDNVPFTVSLAPNNTNFDYNLKYVIGTDTSVATLSSGSQVVNIVLSESATIKFIEIEEATGQQCGKALNESFAITVGNRPSVVMNSIASICEDESTDLELTFEGTAPFNIRISNIGTFVFADAAGTGDTVITVSPIVTTTYTIEDLTDASTGGCANAILAPAPEVTIAVTAKPVVTIVASNDSICKGEVVNIDFRVQNVVPNVNNEVVLSYKGIGGTTQSINLTEDGLNPGEYIKTIVSGPTSDIVYQVVSLMDGSSPSCGFNYSGVEAEVVVYDNITANISASAVDVCNNESINLTVTVNGRAGDQITFTLRDELGVDTTLSVPANSQTTFAIANIQTDKSYTLVNTYYNKLSTCVLTTVPTLDINHNDVPNAEISFVENACEGEEFEFELNILSGEGDVTVRFLTDKFGDFNFTGTVAGSPYRVPYTYNTADSLQIRIASISSEVNITCPNTTFTPDTVKLRVFPIPTAEISADRPTIVAGASSNLLFVVRGDTVGYPDNIRVEYAADGIGGNFVEDNVGVPGFVPANNFSTPNHTANVTPTSTTIYSIVKVTQGACISTDIDDVTVNVVNGKAVAIAGSANLCTSDSLPVTFSIANGEQYYIKVRITEVNSGNNYEYVFPNIVSDGDQVKAPNFYPTTSLPFVGPVQISIVNAAELGGTTLNESDVPNPFAGMANFNIQEVKTVAMVSDTTGCFGQQLPVVFTIEGTGEFNISFRSLDNGNVNRSFTASENDSPVSIQILPSELDLGEHNFIFGVTPTNSLSNSCPIDTVGSARIYVKPSLTSSIDFNPVAACEGEPFEVNFSIAPDSLVNVSYRVDSSGTSTFNTITGIQGSNVLIDNLIAVDDVTYTILNVEYNDAPACPNPTILSKTLKVTPQPTASFVDVVSDTNICFGETADLRIQFSASNYPVSYTFTDSATVTRNLKFMNLNGTNDTIIKVNPLSTSKFYITKLTQVNAPSCSSLKFDAINVTVGKELRVNDYRLSADSICQGDELAILIDVDGTPDIIARFSDGVNTFLATLPNSTGFDTIRINPSPVTNTTYTLIDLTDGSSLACTKTFNLTDDIVVRQTPSISISADPTVVCYGDSVRLRITVNGEDSVDFTISDQIDTFTKTFTDIDPGIQFKYITPLLLNANTFKVDSLYYSDGKACKVYNTSSFSVQTNEVPSASIFVGNTDKDTVVCEGFPVDLTFNITGSGVRTVYFANDRGFSSAFTASPSEVTKVLSINPYPESGAIKYYITRVVSNNGAVCDSIPTDTVLVNVNPTPTVDITADANPRCLNDANPTTITFNFNGVGPFEFDYTDGENVFTLTADSDSDSDSRMDKTITVAPGKTTTYNVIRITDKTLPNACVNNGGNAYTLVVNQPAEAEVFNNDDVICSGEVKNIVYSVRGKAPISVRFQISDGAGYLRDTLITGLSTGVYNYAFADTAQTTTNTNYTVNIVEALDGNTPQCASSGIGVARITVNAVPRISNFNTALDTICAGDVVDLNFLVTNGFGNYAVEYGANGISKKDTLNGLPSGGGPATIELTPNVTTRYRKIKITDLLTGCFTTYSGTIPQDTVVVLRNPIVNVSADANTYCSDSQAQITVIVTGDDQPNGIFLDDIFLNGVAIPGAPFAIDQTQVGSASFFKIISVNLPAGTPENSSITFGSITDGNNLMNPNRIGGCNTDVKDTINFIVNPVAVATIANPNSETICESDTTKILINLTGNGDISVRLAIIDGTDTLASPVFTGTEATSPITYKTADYNLIGKSIRYAIDSVSSIANGVACSGSVGVPSSKTYVIKGNPHMAIAPTDTTICNGDELQVNFSITPVGVGNGPYDFYTVYHNGNVADNDTTEFLNVGNVAVDFIRPSESGILYVNYLANRSTPKCKTQDSVAIEVTVNPKANALLIDTVPQVFCEDDQAGFNIRLEGEGIITAIYRNLNTNNIDSFKNLAGEYFVPVIQAANTTAVYEVIAVNDQSTPRCIETNFSTLATVTVYPRPQAILSGEFTTCEGGSSTVGIQLLGSNADSIIVYFSDKLNNTIDTSFSARVGFYSSVLAPIDTAFFTIDSVAYVNFGCTVSDPALINQDTAKIYVRPLPIANIEVPSIESCNGQDIVFNVNFAYNGPYDLSFKIDNNAEQNASNVNGNFLITVPAASDTTKLKVTSLVYRDIPQCSSENVDSLIVNVNDSLKVTVMDTICNSVATGFQFDLEIEGGQESSYSFNGTDPLLARGLTPEIPNGTYTYAVQDGSGCPAVVFVGDHTCECISDAGTFNVPASPIEVCEDDTANVIANYIGGAMKDANDTMLFVLHDKPNTQLGNIFATDSIAKFPFKNNLLYNTVYYISAVVGDSVTGAAVNTADRCLSVSEGVPVVFRKRSTVTIELAYNDSGEVCDNNLICYKFIFEGDGPFDVTWNDGVSTRSQTFVSNVSPPICSQTSISGDGQIDITIFKDNGNAYPCNTVINAPLQYTARPLPDAVFDVSNDKPCGFEVVDFSIRNLDPTAIYSWNLDGEPYNGNPISYSFDENGPAIAKAYATNIYGCVDSTERIIDVNLPVVPTITFTGNSVTNRVCRGDALTFTADVIMGAGGNSSAVKWYVNGDLKQTSSVLNTYSPSAFNVRGIYEVVAENLYNGCTNVDTFRFEVQGPGADVIFDPEFCVDEGVSFSLGNVQDVDAVQWSFSGATTINSNNSTVNITFNEGFPSNDVVNVTLTLTSAAGCTYDTLFDVTVHDLDVKMRIENDFNNLQRHCLGFVDTVITTETSVSGLYSAWNYDFGDGTTRTEVNGNNITHEYAAPGVYNAKVELVDQFGCRDMDSLRMEILALPIVEALDTFACLSQDLNLFATGAVTYQWTSSPFGIFSADTVQGQSPSVQTNFGQSYAVNVVGTDIEGCTNEANISVDIYDLESPLIRPNYRAVFDTSYKIGYVLPVNYDLADVRFIYEWTPGVDITCVDCPDPTISTFESQNYVLSITDIYGCFDEEALVNIIIERESSLDVPDAFTPGTGIVNRFIGPDGWALETIVSFQIFAKDGSMVHNAAGLKEEVVWDGTYKGKDLSSQTFTYKVVAKTLIGETLTKTGTFDLLR